MGITASNILKQKTQTTFSAETITLERVYDTLLKIYNMSKKEREELGRLGRGHIMKNYNYENFKKLWVDCLLQFYEKHGSWKNRKLYKPWNIQEV